MERVFLLIPRSSLPETNAKDATICFLYFSPTLSTPFPAGTFLLHFIVGFLLIFRILRLKGGLILKVVLCNTPFPLKHSDGLVFTATLLANYMTSSSAKAIYVYNYMTKDGISIGRNVTATILRKELLRHLVWLCPGNGAFGSLFLKEDDTQWGWEMGIDCCIKRGK